MRFLLPLLFMTGWAYAQCESEIAGKAHWAKLELDKSGVPLDTDKGMDAIDLEVAILIGEDIIEGQLIDIPFRNGNRVSGEFEILTSDRKTLILKNRQAIREVRVQPRKSTSSKATFDRKYATWRWVQVDAGLITDEWERKFLIGKVVAVYVKSDLVEEEILGKLIALAPYEILTASGKTRVVRDVNSIEEIRTRTPRLR